MTHHGEPFQIHKHTKNLEQSMSTYDLWIEGRTYSPAALRNADYFDDFGLSDYARATLDICHQWLTGQPTFVLKTSGSTGAPKVITLTRRQMEASARATGQALGLQKGMRALVCLPTRYIAGRMMLVRGFVLGMSMVVVEPSGNPFAALLDGGEWDGEFDFTALVPLQLQTALDAGHTEREILNRMQAILIGGGAVGSSLYKKLQTIEAPIYHTYGMTETVTHVALRRLNGAVRADAFSPLPGVELGVDQRDCLTIRSVVTGGKVVRTNDRVDLRADGSFIWLGRVDNVVNSGGVKVQVERVERAVEEVIETLADPQFSERRFFVGPLPDERLGEAVTLFVEGGPFDRELEQRLLWALQQSLPKYERPRSICYVANFAETPTGKIDRLTTLLNR